MFTIPICDKPQAPLDETVEQRVRRLLATWRAETGFLSSSTALVSHPAYQELIALGAAALPFLFRDLEQTLDGHLSSALVAITGAQPVPTEEGGNIRHVAERWLGWTRRVDRRAVTNIRDLKGEADLREMGEP
jgi:hypothetical protein